MTIEQVTWCLCSVLLAWGVLALIAGACRLDDGEGGER